MDLDVEEEEVDLDVAVEGEKEEEADRPVDLVQTKPGVQLLPSRETKLHSIKRQQTKLVWLFFALYLGVGGVNFSID